ncbi:hypothetical protein KP509_03G019500 [Ceratopteris richardii]|uniref:Uncharacterized protein n=1 Tax=Ceratopteris richardii TaxID=49495 RepID=A0A8T2UXN7_CERRI|nr:hypothetical protein KP509_03G019500 [Ceratopteris richardii]
MRKRTTTRRWENFESFTYFELVLHTSHTKTVHVVMRYLQITQATRLAHSRASHRQSRPMSAHQSQALSIISSVPRSTLKAETALPKELMHVPFRCTQGSVAKMP